MNTKVEAIVDDDNITLELNVKQTFSWSDIKWVIDRMASILVEGGIISPGDIAFTKEQKLEILNKISDELDASDITVREDDPAYADDEWCNADKKIQRIVYDYIWDWADDYWPDLIRDEDSFKSPSEICDDE